MEGLAFPGAEGAVEFFGFEVFGDGGVAAGEEGFDEVEVVAGFGVGDPGAVFDFFGVDGADGDGPGAGAEVGDAVFFVDFAGFDGVGAGVGVVVVFEDAGDAVFFEEGGPVFLDVDGVGFGADAPGGAVVADEEVGDLGAGFEGFFEPVVLCGDVFGVAGVEVDDGEPVSEVDGVGGVVGFGEGEDGVEHGGGFGAGGVGGVVSCADDFVVAYGDDFGDESAIGGAGVLGPGVDVVEPAVVGAVVGVGEVAADEGEEGVLCAGDAVHFVHGFAGVVDVATGDEADGFGLFGGHAEGEGFGDFGGAGVVDAEFDVFACGEGGEGGAEDAVGAGGEGCGGDVLGVPFAGVFDAPGEGVFGWGGGDGFAGWAGGAGLPAVFGFGVGEVFPGLVGEGDGPFFLAVFGDEDGVEGEVGGVEGVVEALEGDDGAFVGEEAVDAAEAEFVELAGFVGAGGFAAIWGDVFAGDFLAAEPGDEAVVVVDAEDEDGIAGDAGGELDVAADGDGDEVAVHAVEDGGVVVVAIAEAGGSGGPFAFDAALAGAFEPDDVGGLGGVLAPVDDGSVFDDGGC